MEESLLERLPLASRGHSQHSQDSSAAHDVEASELPVSSKAYRFLPGLHGRARHVAHTESAYLTLIPLSDERLKPRRTTLWASIVVVLILAASAATFFLVDRQVTAGTVNAWSPHTKFNITTKSYQVLLQASLPIYNPNYLSVTVSGTLNVSFFDVTAGTTLLEPVVVPARSKPQIINMTLDVSALPTSYLEIMIAECTLFPHTMVFFLSGNLEAKYLSFKDHLQVIDTYFMIPCKVTSDSMQ